MMDGNIHEMFINKLSIDMNYCYIASEEDGI